MYPPGIAETEGNLLDVANLGRRIGETWCWQGVSFALKTGTLLGIRGPSGCGKTLLLRAIAGLDPVQVGQVNFGGQPLASQSMPQYRRQVIYVHQRPAVFPGTVAENLALVRQLSSNRSHFSAQSVPIERLQTWIAALGRPTDFLARPADSLSGGELQILAWLRAAQLDPVVLLLDEPTASLDAATGQRLESLLQDWLGATSGRAAVLVSHDETQLQRLTTAVYTLPATHD